MLDKDEARFLVMYIEDNWDAFHMDLAEKGIKDAESYAQELYNKLKRMADL